MGGHSEESPVAMEALRTSSPPPPPRVCIIPFLSSLMAQVTSPGALPVAAPSPGPPGPPPHTCNQISLLSSVLFDSFIFEKDDLFL